MMTRWQCNNHPTSKTIPSAQNIETVKNRAMLPLLAVLSHRKEAKKRKFKSPGLPFLHIVFCFRSAILCSMNATAEQLDHYLRQADPATARTVEQIVGLVIQRFKSFPEGDGPPSPPVASKAYKMRTYDMGGFQPGIDPYKLGQLPEEF
jgi:hypothetical protein